MLFRRRSGRGGDGLHLGRVREVRGLDIRGRRHRFGRGVGVVARLGRLRRRGTAHILLCLGAVVIDILLHHASSISGVLAGNTLQLMSLVVDNGLGVGNVGVDELAVVDVDQRTQVSTGNGDEGETPQRQPLDQPVGRECGRESLLVSTRFHLACKYSYRSRVDDILGKEDPLELDQTKIGQLLEVLQHRLDIFLGNGEVPAGADGAHHILRHGQSSGALDESSDFMISAHLQEGDGLQLTSQRPVHQLEGPSKERQVTCGENETDGASEGDGGGSRLFPLRSQLVRD